MKFILLQENLQQARSILKKLDISEDDIRFKDFKEYYEQKLGNNWGYFGFLTNLIFKQGEHTSSVKKLIDYIVNNKDIIKSLPKNITNYSSLEKISDDITIQEGWKKYKQEFVNQLSGGIKQKAKKDEDLKDEYINSDENTKKDILQNFIPKIARYDNYKRFKEDLKSFLNKTDDIETILKDIENQDNAYLVYNKNNIIIAEIYKYEASCELGSKAWCISTGKGSWDMYVSGLEKQYFVWNLNLPKSSNDSQLGATIREDGTVRTAHYKNDNKASLRNYTEKYNIPIELFTPIDLDKDFTKLLKADRLNDEVFDGIIRNNNRELIEKYYDKIPNKLKIKHSIYTDEDLNNMGLSDITKEILSANNDKLIKTVNYLSIEETPDSEIKNFVNKMTFVDKIYFLKRIMTVNLDYGSDFDEKIITKKLFPNTDITMIDIDEEMVYIDKDKEEFFDDFLDIHTEVYYHLSSITTHSSMYGDTGEIDYCYNALSSDQGLEFMEILEYIEKNSLHKRLKNYFTEFITNYNDNQGIEYYNTESLFLKLGLKEVFEVLELCSSAIEEGADQFIGEDMDAFINLENKFDFDEAVGIPINMILDSFNEDKLTDSEFEYNDWANDHPLYKEVPDFHSMEGTYEYFGMAEVSEEYKNKIDEQLKKITDNIELELSNFLEKNDEKAHKYLIDNGYNENEKSSNWQLNDLFYYEKITGDITSIIPLTSIIENGNAVMYIIKKEALEEEKFLISKLNISTDGSDVKPRKWENDNIKRLREKGVNVKQINIFDRFEERTKDPNQLSLFEENLIINFKKFKQRKSI